VVDYRALNKQTVKNQTLLPLTDKLQDRFQGAKIFTKVDLQVSFNLIRIAPREEYKTAFRTKYRLYKYLVMLFRLTNAPATLQAIVTEVLYKYLDDFCVVYIDNVMIYSRREADHKEHVKKVFDALNKAGLKVKLKKSEFELKEVQFLGHIITAEGLQIDPEKIKAVLEWPDLRSADDVCKLTGLTNYCRRFIKDYS